MDKKIDPKDPKTWGVKILNEAERFWSDILTKTEGEIISLEKMLKFNYAIRDMCNSFIILEKKKDREKSKKA